ncbi:hypothetical protein RUM44_006590 [Polyplax serrata]|uniref:Uncharacterized protein n=1 Tax=Polyplax serrata TaxID=468196 RepID=A0ABR1AIG9_POLSC
MATIRRRSRAFRASQKTLPSFEKFMTLFPQLDHQKRVIAKSLKTQKWPNRSSWSSHSVSESSSKKWTASDSD